MIKNTPLYYARPQIVMPALSGHPESASNKRGSPLGGGDDKKYEGEGDGKILNCHARLERASSHNAK